MKIKMAMTLAIFGIGLVALLFSEESKDQDPGKRIGRLEAQVEDLQKQVKELRSQLKALESRPLYRFLAPDTRIPNNQIPPGAKPYKYNGQEFWLVPLSPDPKS